jgi:hypothetical protein
LPVTQKPKICPTFAHFRNAINAAGKRALFQNRTIKKNLFATDPNNMENSSKFYCKVKIRILILEKSPPCLIDRLKNPLQPSQLIAP